MLEFEESDASRMKITVQAKIAELEQRIAKLEGAAKVHGRITRTLTSFSGSGALHEHWNKLWAEFNEVMKAAFK